jgi:hypothetical protein
MPHDTGDGFQGRFRFEQAAGKRVTQRVQTASVRSRQGDTGATAVGRDDVVKIIVAGERRECSASDGTGIFPVWL